MILTMYLLFKINYANGLKSAECLFPVEEALLMYLYCGYFYSFC